MDFDCVVAADAAGGIGKDNDLPWPRLREDLRFLKRITCDAPEGRRNAVIMGRRTWESVPSKMQPLPGRINVVISRQPLTLPEDVRLAPSLDAALDAAPEAAALFVIGGAQIFAHAFDHPRCRYVYLTRIAATFDCDTFLPSLDAFRLDEVLATHREHDIDFAIQRWVRPRPGT